MKIVILNNLEREVLFVDKDDCRLQRGDLQQGEINLGLTLPFELKIYINKDISLELQKRILVHELTHAFLFSFGFDGMTINEEELCYLMGMNASHLVELANEILMTV